MSTQPPTIPLSTLSSLPNDAAHSHIETGWVDVKTGESGAFDKNGNPRPYTWWEKVEHWWDGTATRRAMVRVEREAKIAEERRKQNDWHYDGIVDMRRTSTRRSDGVVTYTHDYKASVYLNPSLKRGYIVDPTEDGAHCPIDYNAYKDDGTVICI